VLSQPFQQFQPTQTQPVIDRKREEEDPDDVGA